MVKNIRSVVGLVLVTLFLSVSTPALAITADTGELDFRESDKQVHAAVSYGIALTGAMVLEHYKVKRWKAVLLSVTTTLVLGALKERFIDSYFSRNDMYANAIGATTAGIVVFSFSL